MWNKSVFFDKNKIYSSLIMPNAYFNAALILIDYISKGSGEYWNKRPDIWKKYDDPIHEILSPLLYNLKHWIELFCKTFLNLWKDWFDKWHNIKLNFCKFKCLCLDLNHNNQLELNETELAKIDNIEILINSLYNNDDKNDEHRYPNANTFLICRKSKRTIDEIRKEWQYTTIDREIIDEDENISEDDFLRYRYEFSIKIQNLCNNWEVWKKEIECIEEIEEIKKMIIELRNFFENIWKKKYFEEKIKEKIKAPPFLVRIEI